MKIKRWLSELWEPERMNDLDISEISTALSDMATRYRWLETLVDDLKQMNSDIDRRLLNGKQEGISDLCARRKAYQDILESVLSARRTVTQAERHNPRHPVDEFINLDRVTA